MLHDEPINLRTRQNHETAALGPLVTVGLCAGSTQRRQGTCAELKPASSGEILR